MQCWARRQTLYSAARPKEARRSSSEACALGTMTGEEGPRKAPMLGSHTDYICAVNLRS